MALIYTNGSHEDVGQMPACSLDLAFGSDENDFACAVSESDHCCEYGSYIYYVDTSNGREDPTEYGGKVTTFHVDTAAKTVTYKGLTWHGILANKVIRPASGQDYKIVSGSIKSVIESLYTELGIGDLFKVESPEETYSLSNFKFDRYTDAYSGIRKMATSVGAKILLVFDGLHVITKILPIVDYSASDEWDADQFSFTATMSDRFINHLICLGKGELKDRVVVDLYMDGNGIISQTQTFFGLDEIVQTYEDSAVENLDELISNGTKRFRELYSDYNGIESQFDSNQNYDIGDIVGATERVTGNMVTSKISKKIFTLEGDEITVTCRVDD